jgi:NitT/TauT family transport system substrate-binding protein
MDENHLVEEIEKAGLTRRELLKRAAGVGVGLSALGMFEVRSALGAAAATRVKWISPRGTLDVMDDFNLWVPIKMGYYRRLGIDLSLSPGDASGNLPQVAAGQVDMGYPSPGVLTSSVAAGIPVISIWEQYPAQVFDFVLNGKSKITHPRQLKGKTIAIFNDIWRTIINPMLVEVGVDPKSVKYRVFGPQWVQAVALGQADAGLVWEGLRAQLVGQSATFGSAFQLKFLVGTQWGSKGPSNTYVVRTADMQDATKKALFTRLLQGSVMGSEFAKANPRAAAQITYGARPLLQKLISPQVAVESMMQLASGYSVFHRRPPHLYGWHDATSWNHYLDAIAKIGQVKKRLNINDVLTNELVRAANQKADVARARRDGKAFKLNEFFRTTTVPKGYPL